MLSLTPTRRLTEFLTLATTRGADASLEELFLIFGLPHHESTLAKVVSAGQVLEGLGLILAPDLSKGELDTPRRIFPIENIEVTPELALVEINSPEAVDFERKSSLMFHHARATANPNAKSTELKSDEVIHSALKSVAAFLTSNGGTLYVGVDDNCNILGIEYDFRLLGEGRRNEDGWELQLRNLLTGGFKDGDNVNDYVDVRFIKIENKCVSRVRVGPRKKLSFLKYKNSYHLFRRQGNRTEEVTIEQVEEFLAMRSIQVL